MNLKCKKCGVEIEEIYGKWIPDGFYCWLCYLRNLPAPPDYDENEKDI